MANKKNTIYTLTIVSMCECGRDVHSFTFTKKTDAQKAMKIQYKEDVKEFKADERVSILERDCYKIYRRGFYEQDHIHADIIKTTLNEIKF